MHVQHFFHAPTWTHTYVVFDEQTRDAVIIDPVLDFDPARWRISTETITAIGDWIESEGLQLHMSLDTHVHADHMSACQEMKRRFAAMVVIGDGVIDVINAFQQPLSLGDDVPRDGSHFDVLAYDEQVLRAGSLSISVIHTPGHTPACVTYRIGDAIFTGDALFLPDQGTGRCDFPGGSASDLFHSIAHKLYSLPDSTRVFAGHDYGPGGRDIAYESTLAAEKAQNVQLPASRSREEFLAFRTARDAGLNPPKLLFPSLQVNVRAGQLPAASASGHRHLLMPIEDARRS